MHPPISLLASTCQCRNAFACWRVHSLVSRGGCVSGHAALRVFVDCVSRRWVGVCIPACMLAYVFTEYKVRRIHNMEMMSAKTNPRSWAYSSETVCICDGQVLQDCRWRSSISWLFHQGHQNHPFWNESPWSHLICHFQFWTCFFFCGVCFATTCKTWLPTLKLCHIFLVEASWRVFKKERERKQKAHKNFNIIKPDLIQLIYSEISVSILTLKSSLHLSQGHVVHKSLY